MGTRTGSGRFGPGRAPTPGPSRRREGSAGERGFTLIEMLVVLAIVGVMAGATALGIGAATRGPSAEAEARRLASQLQLAADDAMVTDRPLALAWDATGYALVTLDGPPPAGEAYRRHRLPSGMRLAVVGAGTPALLGIDGSGLPFAARLTDGGDRWTIGYDGLKAIAIRMPKT